MKLTALYELQQFLQQKEHLAKATAFAIIIKDDFDRKEAVGLLTKSLVSDVKHPELSVKTFVGDKVSKAVLLDELQGISMLAEKSIVVIQDADKLDKDVADALREYTANPNPSSVLVVVAATLNARSKLYKQLEAAGVLLHVAALSPWEQEKHVASILARQVAAAGKKAPVEVCQSVARQVGGDPALATSEMDKLITYCGDRKAITNDDVSAVCTKMHTETVWQLGDAILRRDVGTALDIGLSMLSDGTALIAVLAMLRKQVQRSFHICSILATGGGPQDITKRFAYMRGKILQQNIHLAQGYGIVRFRQALQLLSETDLAARNSGTAPALLLETLLVKIAV